MIGPDHLRVVAVFAGAGARTYRFPSDVKRVCGVKTTIRPDAWHIRESDRHLLVYEVVVHESLDRHRRAAYRRLMTALAKIGWRLFLWRVSKDGTKTIADVRN